MKAHLRKKKQQGTAEEALGNELVTLLKPYSPAFKVTKEWKNFDDIVEKAGSWKLTLQKLEKKLPPDTKENEGDTAVAVVKKLLAGAGRAYEVLFGPRGHVVRQCNRRRAGSS